MMAEGGALQGAEENEGKGFAATLREEGYDSGSGRSSGGKLGGLLSSVSTPPTSAVMMPDRNLLLPKGTFIDCVLETKLDTTVPGMTSCVIPRDVYSANGRVLLIERGSKAIGEYKGAVENGLNRIFVLWTQIQTPKGVRVNIDSPATDALGGSGMAGEIDFHWWARFGNALLFTLIQDGFDFAMTKQTENNGGVNYYQNSEDGMNQIIQEAMRQSGNIPPTLTKNQGERVGIFVARDVGLLQGLSAEAHKPIKTQTQARGLTHSGLYHKIKMTDTNYTIPKKVFIFENDVTDGFIVLEIFHTTSSSGPKRMILPKQSSG